MLEVEKILFYQAESLKINYSAPSKCLNELCLNLVLTKNMFLGNIQFKSHIKLLWSI